MTVPLRKRMRRELRVRALLLLRPLLSRLPHRLAAGLGGAAGWLAWYLAPRHRRAALEHLALAFPDRPASWHRAVGRASFVNLGRSALEVLIAGRLDLARVVQLDPDSLAALRAAYARGRGIVALSCHVGNWELLARRVGLEGIPIATVAREAQDPRLTAILQGARLQSGIASLWRGDPGAIREMIRRIRAGGLVAVLIDQDTDVAGHFVPFFGREAFTPRAPADLAVRTGAEVIFARIHRVAPTLHRAIISRLPLPDSGDRDSDAKALIAAATAAIEGHVRAHPDEWVWMHARWRTQPAIR